MNRDNFYVWMDKIDAFVDTDTFHLWKWGIVIGVLVLILFIKWCWGIFDYNQIYENDKKRKK